MVSFSCNLLSPTPSSPSSAKSNSKTKTKSKSKSSSTEPPSSRLSPTLLRSPLFYLLLLQLSLCLLLPSFLSSEDLSPYPLLASTPARPQEGLGLLQVGENLSFPASSAGGRSGYRYLRADHSLLGGRWVGALAERAGEEAGGEEEGVGDSIFSTFVLQEGCVSFFFPFPSFLPPSFAWISSPLASKNVIKA